jgi:Ran GTPase-activating protein (RanGAP) involved in mRNA processing and transport
VEIVFMDGQSVAVEIVFEETVRQLRQRINQLTGRLVSVLFNEQDEEALLDGCSAMQAVATCSLVATEESGGAVIVSQGLGEACTDGQFQDLCAARHSRIVCLDVSRCAKLSSTVLFDCVRRLTGLRVLSLQGCKLGPGMAAGLCGVIDSSPLTELNIAGNSIGWRHSTAANEEPRAIAAALKRTSGLTTLTFGDAEESGFVHTKECRGECFDVGARVVYSGKQCIVSKEANAKGHLRLQLPPAVLHRNMTVADLSGLNLGFSGAVIASGFLPRCLRLHALDLSNNRIGEFDVDGTQLQFTATTTGVIAIAAMLAHPSLSSLNVSQNLLVTWTELEANSGSGSDSDADLDGAAWQEMQPEFSGIDAISSALASNNQLTSLDISGNDICAYGSPHGLVRFAAALETNRTLTRLNIANNSLGLGANAAEALAGALRANTALTSVNLLGNEFADASIQVLIAVMEEKGALQTLCGITGSLARLDCRKSGLNPGCIGLLAHELKCNQALRTLNLGNNYIAADVYGKALPKGRLAIGKLLGEQSGVLSSLDLSANYLYSEGLQVVAAALETNRTLSDLNIALNQSRMNSNYQSDMSGIEAFCAVLARNPALAKLTLSGDHPMSQAVTVTTSTSKAEFKSKHLQASGVRVLAAFLPRCKGLLLLDLADNDFGREGAKALAKALEAATALTSLNIAQNSLQAEGSLHVSAVLQNQCCPALAEFTFSGDSPVSKSVTIDTAMTEADVSSSLLSTSGAELLAAVLPRCPRMRKLTFSGEAKFVCEGQSSHLLTMHTDMVDADFSGAILQNSGATILQAFLPRCTALASLNLERSYIDHAMRESISLLCSQQGARCVH